MLKLVVFLLFLHRKQYPHYEHIWISINKKSVPYAGAQSAGAKGKESNSRKNILIVWKNEKILYSFRRENSDIPYAQETLRMTGCRQKSGIYKM